MMASPLALRGPQCISCTRKIASNLENAFQWPGRQQLRGMKKDAKVATTKVLLLQDITRYGPKGSIVSVPSGTMRNLWYPKKMAEYVTPAKMTEFGITNGAAIERDSTFPSRKQRKLTKKLQEAEAEARQTSPEATPIVQAPQIEIKQLNPDQAAKILERLLPQKLDFYRTPVGDSLGEERISPSIPSASTVSAAARAGKVAKAPAPIAIYGSVSTNDIATNLKAILAEDKEGAQVLLGSEDISFVQQAEEKDRVKHLGVFQIRIKLKGAQDVLQRSIQVSAQG